MNKSISSFFVVLLTVLLTDLITKENIKILMFTIIIQNENM